MERKDHQVNSSRTVISAEALATFINNYKRSPEEQSQRDRPHSAHRSKSIRVCFVTL